jgi:cellulose synthase/poly-beta-1,6-N-acetylglucosamine synthase-like glycosyltransferase
MPSDPVLLFILHSVAVLPFVALGLLGLNLMVLWTIGQIVPERPLPKDAAALAPNGLPTVLIQLPIYNESTVVARLVKAVAALDWPRDRLRIQLLDDSTDGTHDLSAALAKGLREDGFDIVCLHRTDRKDYKAGALANGLAVDDSEFIAIFDADFVPPRDFLLRALAPLLADDALGFAQARWEHLNAWENLLTASQGMMIDAHFVIEQRMRSKTRLLLPFNGTCGVWRRAAIEDAGGWSADTLCEDLDLSIRARLKGWRGVFLPDLAVPGELPATFAGWRAQQFRWTKGFAQVAVKLLGRVWRSDLPLSAKVALTMQTGQTACYPLTAISVLGTLILLLDREHATALLSIAGGSVALLGIGGSALCLLTGLLVLKRRRRSRFPIIFAATLLLNAGLMVSNSRAVWEALIGAKSPFVRTPKQGALGMAPTLDKSGPTGAAELLMAMCIGIALVVEAGWLSPLFSLSIIGLILVGGGLACERGIAAVRRAEIWRSRNDRLDQPAE